MKDISPRESARHDLHTYAAMQHRQIWKTNIPVNLNSACNGDPSQSDVCAPGRRRAYAPDGWAAEAILSIHRPPRYRIQHLTMGPCVSLLKASPFIFVQRFLIRTQTEGPALLSDRLALAAATAATAAEAARAMRSWMQQPHYSIFNIRVGRKQRAFRVLRRANSGCMSIQAIEGRARRKYIAIGASVAVCDGRMRMQS